MVVLWETSEVISAADSEVVVGVDRHLGDADQHLVRRTGQHHVAVVQGQRPYILMAELGRQRQNAGPQLQRRLMDGGGRHIALTRGERARIIGSDVGILGRDDSDLLKRNAQCLGRHLGKDGIRPLPYLGGTNLQIDGAILIEQHAGASNFDPHRIGVGAVAKARHPDAAPYPTCRILPQTFGLEPIPLEHLATTQQAVRQPSAVDGLLVDLIDVPFPRHVGDAHIKRIQPQFGAGVIQHAFKGKYHLRRAVTAHGTGGGQVAVEGLGIITEGAARIEVADSCCHRRWRWSGRERHSRRCWRARRADSP